MINTRWIAILSFSVLAAGAQNRETSYQGQTWTGLLVSSSCDPGKKTSAQRKNSTAEANQANREADLTAGGRTTTPAVDESGTRGQSTALDQGSKTASGKQTLPETGDVMAKDKSSTDPGWAQAHRQARSLDSSCGFDKSATSFALLLANGSLLHFDELANQAIVKQLPSSTMGEKSHRFFRVSVQGKMQNGKIALNSLQL
jgi:hypothetical protein